MQSELFYRKYNQNYVSITLCPDCKAPMSHSGTHETMVGYQSPPGHDHDDNCKKRLYVCDNGHEHRISRQNRCHVCDWVGKTECSACYGEWSKKVAHWPEEEQS